MTNVTSIIESLQLWNRRLAYRIANHPTHQVRMDSFAAHIENMRLISELRKQQSPARPAESQLG